MGGIVNRWSLILYSTDSILQHRNVMNVCFLYPTLSWAFLEFISGRSTVRIQSYNIRSVNRWSLILYSSDLNPTSSDFLPVAFATLQHRNIIRVVFLFPT